MIIMTTRRPVSRHRRDASDDGDDGDNVGSWMLGLPM
jgi:hypothetical protein